MPASDDDLRPLLEQLIDSAGRAVRELERLNASAESLLQQSDKARALLERIIHEVKLGYR
jgi:hypothetical protein